MNCSMAFASFPEFGPLTGDCSSNSASEDLMPRKIRARAHSASDKIDSPLVNPLAFLPEFSVPEAGGNSRRIKMETQKRSPMRLRCWPCVIFCAGSGWDRQGRPLLDTWTSIRFRMTNYGGKATVQSFKENKSIVDISPTAKKSFKDNAPLWFSFLRSATPVGD